MRPPHGAAPALVLVLSSALALLPPTGPVRARADGAPAPAAGFVLPDDRLGVRTAPLLLLSRPDVRAELGLDARLAAEADRAVADLHARAAALRGKTGAESLEARKSVDAAQRAWIDAHLSPAQRDRLAQVDLQWEGPAALVNRPVVADTLGLTPDQRRAIREALDRRNQARRAQGPAAAAEAELARTALGLLTPAQRERWRAMLGRPFEPKLAQARASVPSPATR